MGKIKLYRINNDKFHEEVFEAVHGHTSGALWEYGVGHSNYIPGMTKQEIKDTAKKELKYLREYHKEVESHLEELIENTDDHIILDEEAPRKWK